MSAADLPVSGSGLFPSPNTESRARARYEGRKIASAIAGFRNTSGDQVGNFARLVLVQAAKPAPTSEYDAWFEEARSSDPRGRARNKTLNGTKLRRAVIMLRSGSSMRDVATALGCTTIARWVEKLPDHLAPFPRIARPADTANAA